MVCPSVWLMLGVISRVTTSRLPPGGWGPLIVMEREGYVACANAGAAKPMQDSNARAMVRRMITDVFLPIFLFPVLRAVPSAVQHGTTRPKQDCVPSHPPLSLTSDMIA